MLVFWKFKNTKRIRVVKFILSETNKTKICTVKFQFQARPVPTQCQLLQVWERKNKRREIFWQEMLKKDQFSKRNIFWHFWKTWSPELKRISKIQNFSFSIWFTWIWLMRLSKWKLQYFNTSRLWMSIKQNHSLSLDSRNYTLKQPNFTTKKRKITTHLTLSITC